MRHFVLVAFVAVATAGFCAEAFERWMSDAALAAAFAGTTIDGHYSDGTTFTESYRADGRLDYRERARALEGHWSVVNGTFCTIYDTSPTGGCFRVTKVSANCYEFYFQARDEAEAARPDVGRPSWTARGWRNDQPTTCTERPSV
jgi:hypothetical protein